MKYSYILCLIIVAIYSNSVAQEKIKVIVDHQNNKTTYLRIDEKNKVDTIKKPIIRRNTILEVEVQNVNPFAIDVSFKANELDATTSGASGFNFSNLLGGISNLSGNSMNLNAKNLPNLDIVASEKSRGLGQSGNSRGQQIQNAFSTINKVESDVIAMKRALISDLVNPNLTKEQIEQKLKERANAGLRDARLEDPNTNIHGYLTSLDNVAIQESAALQSNLNSLENEVNQADQQNSRGEPGKDPVLNPLNVGKIVSSVSTSLDNISKNIEDVNTMATSLTASSFTKRFEHKVNSDEVELEILYKPSTLAKSVTGSTSTNDAESKKLSFSALGDFKITTSIAMAFAGYGDKSKHFFINEAGVVQADTYKSFVPNISTMLNFYPYLGRTVNIGGAFGLSFPLSDAKKDLNFLLGPTVILGNKSKVFLAGGIAYGPTNRLSNGLEIGQTTTLKSLDPHIRSVYDLGYFFSISFSLFNLN